MKFTNPWSEQGEHSPPKWMGNNFDEMPNGFLGGEVINNSDTNWLISRVNNSNQDHFLWLFSNTNSDEMELVRTVLEGDVDAVWPAGKKLRNSETGDVVTSGAFKLRDHRNTVIEGANGDYIIYDFSLYFNENELPIGWNLPDKYRK
jgi:hypothetical protein